MESLLELLLQGALEPLLDVCRERRRFHVAVHFDSLSRGIHDDATVLAVLQMPHQFLSQHSVKFTVELFRQFANHFSALHRSALHRGPRLKYLLSRSRSLSRARSKRDLTAGTESPIILAVSLVENSSTSRSTNTVRNCGSNSSMA